MRASSAPTAIVSRGAASSDPSTPLAGATTSASTLSVSITQIGCDERGEDRRQPQVADMELLVPLHAQHEAAVRALDRLDHAILRVRDGTHLGAQPVDRLVVVGVDRSGVAE
jgi:hypothetical protein